MPAPGPLRTVHAPFSAHGSSLYKGILRHPATPLLCCLHNTRLQPAYVALDTGPIDAVPRRAGRCTCPCCCTHLLSSRLAGSANSLAKRDHEEVCPLSRRVMFQPTTPIHPITGQHSLCPQSCSRTAIGRLCSLLSPKGAIRGFHVPLAEVHRVRCLLWTGRPMGHERAIQRRSSHLHYRFGSSVTATSACHR